MGIYEWKVLSGQKEIVSLGVGEKYHQNNTEKKDVLMLVF